MAITTVADASAKCIPATEFWRSYAVAGGSCLRSTWFETSAFGTAGTTPVGLAGQVLDGTGDYANSYFRYTNPPGGQKKYLCKVQATIMGQTGGVTFLHGTGSVYVADRLWHNAGLSITSTGSQTVNSVAFPARDVNGSTNGEGVWLGLEVAAANLGAATAIITISYTNSAGTAGRTGIIDMSVNGAARGFLSVMRMDTGDTGVRSVQTYTASTSLVSGGPIYLVAFRPITFVFGGHGRCQRSFFGPLDIGFPEFQDNSVPMVGSNGYTTANNGIFSEWTFAEG